MKNETGIKEELENIAKIEREARSAWDASRLSKDRNVEYLKIMYKCIKLRAKILGVFPPNKK